MSVVAYSLLTIVPGVLHYKDLDPFNMKCKKEELSDCRNTAKT